MNAIEVNSLCKIFSLYKKPKDRLREWITLNHKKYHHKFHALKEISFNIKSGETVGIIGENGSGKSTLLKTICGVLRPTSGSLKVNGRVSSLLELGTGFHPEFTGRENVYMNGALMGFSQAEMDRRFPEIESFTDIGEYIDQPVKSYSSGMFVRLAFAAAINVDPDILVIDEALAVGDMLFQHRCMTKIRKLKTKKVIIFVSHDMSAIVNFCDRAIWLRRGEVQEIGDPKVVSKQYQAYVYGQRDREYEEADDAKTEEGIPLSGSHGEFPHSLAIQDHAAKSTRFGNARARIITMELMDPEGRPLSVIWGGSPIYVRIGVQSAYRIRKPIVGFIVNDRLGNTIFGTNTDIEGITLPELKPGDKFFLDFRFTWPHIASGSYSFSPAIADVRQEDLTIYDWVHDVLVIKANNEKPIVGLIKQTDIKVTFNKLT